MAAEHTASSPANNTQHRAWAMLISITMLNVIGMTSVLPVLPFLVQRYVDTPDHLAVWVGVLEAVNALCAFIVAPLFGGLSDRFGRRPVIVIATLGATLGFLTFGIGGSIWVLLAGRIIQGITAGDMPALFAYAADITPPKDRAKRFGLLGALNGIGFMIGPALGGLLAAVHIDLPVFFTAAMAFIVATLSFFFLPESLKPESRTSKLEVTQLHPFSAFKKAFVRPQLRGLLVAVILVGIPFSMFVNNFSVLALDELAWTATSIGLLTSCIGVLDIVLQGGLMQLLLPRLGERGVMIAGVIAQAVGLLAFALVASVLAQPWLLIIGALTLGGGQGPATAAMDGVLSQQVGEDEQGWVAGVIQSLNSGIGVIAPLLAGFLYATVAHSAPYWLGFGLVILAIIVISKAPFASPSLRRSRIPGTSATATTAATSAEAAAATAAHEGSAE
ncbi:MFS transporter [Leucobacter sp. UT-8R-CII-1-4]|uniref:MFS transporter n=1 Tax=Leucobacter sp. UT-8R-CII-1-4 TaxID=3040075 RepID=UPI0024A8C6E2|nr:MFS transporter [Leucobacter sp. UT-8R-CII-1-4]MDI6024162.1 MFS transporter [Leucobacter sp. UT-8R-CII-1-4]